MVENLTLSKMNVLFESAQPLLNNDANLTFEGNSGSLEQKYRLRVSYILAGQNLTPESKVTLGHSGRFQCTVCGKTAKKLFDSYCYPCLQRSAQADRCFLNPVGCHYMAGTCREPQWGEEVCYHSHYVYLAYTDKFKVGITRRQQIPVRWIDQGATMAVLLAETGSRHQAGRLEDFLSGKFADKSHWMKMLKMGNRRPEQSEFEAVRQEALRMLENGLADSNGSPLTVPAPQAIPNAGTIRILHDAKFVELEFPLWNEIPEKIVSLNLDKTPVIESVIRGVKGQYLFLEHGVLNVRRHEGYVVNCGVL